MDQEFLEDPFFFISISEEEMLNMKDKNTTNW